MPERHYNRCSLMPRSAFSRVESAARSLPDVEVGTAWGKPALKVRGQTFVCIASHKSAEPDSLVVPMDIADRDALIQDAPETYYLKEHYVGYPCVLVRLSRVRADALRDLVAGAYRYVSTGRKPLASGARSRSGRTPRTR